MYTWTRCNKFSHICMYRIHICAVWTFSRRRSDTHTHTRNGSRGGQREDNMTKWIEILRWNMVWYSNIYVFQTFGLMFSWWVIAIQWAVLQPILRNTSNWSWAAFRWNEIEALISHIKWNNFWIKLPLNRPQWRNQHWLPFSGDLFDFVETNLHPLCFMWRKL